MSKAMFKRPVKRLLIIILVSSLIIFLGYLYKEKYLNCFLLETVVCLKSSKYSSHTKQFSFRYPNMYPLTYKTGGELTRQYGFDDKFDEWVNFSTKFYPNAGGDRLGSIIVTKKPEYKSVLEYANKIEEGFNKLPEGWTPSKIEFLKISGKEAVRVTTNQQPSSFDPPSDEYILVENGKLYRISFDFNDYVHKKPLTYYETSKNIILSTFTLY